MKREYKLEQKAGEIAQVAIIESSAIGIPNDHIEPWVKDFAIGVAVAAATWADQHPAWVSVEKELPKERGHYLAYTEYGQVWLTEYMQDKGGHWDWFVAPICVGAVSKVTHWMPLPTPPVKKGGEQ